QLKKAEGTHVSETKDQPAGEQDVEPLEFLLSSMPRRRLVCPSNCGSPLPPWPPLSLWLAAVRAPRSLRRPPTRFRLSHPLRRRRLQSRGLPLAYRPTSPRSTRPRSATKSLTRSSR